MPLNIGDSETTEEEVPTPPVAEDIYVPPAQPEIVNPPVVEDPVIEEEV
jgi:hypothetical protein